MVYRIYVEKKSGLDHEAQNLKSDLLQLLGIGGVQNVRVLTRRASIGSSLITRFIRCFRSRSWT